jgi:hypothetical protein
MSDLLLGTLGAVLGARLHAVLNRSGVVSTTDDVIADTRKVTDTAATDGDDGVLLEVMTLTGDVSGDFDAVDQANTGNLTKSRVRLLGARGENAGADAALLGVVLKGSILGLLGHGTTALANQLVDSRQSVLLFVMIPALYLVQRLESRGQHPPSKHASR